MVDALSQADRTRLLRLLALGGSSFDGEAVNAVRLACRFVRERGLTLAEALQTAATQEVDLARLAEMERDAYERGRQDAKATAPTTPDAPRTWRDCVRDCQRYRDFLSDWESRFLANIAQWRSALTPKQQSKLHDICSRLQVRGWE